MDTSPTDQSINVPQHLCLHHLLADLAACTPDMLAILAPGRVPLTYGHLYKHIGNVVQTLQAIGLGRHAQVALMLPNGPEMAVAALAVAIGATCAPLNPASSNNEFEFSLADLNAAALIVQAGIDSPARAVAQARGIRIIELSPVLEAEAGIFTLASEARTHAAPQMFAQPDDVALLVPTGGTTSRPKIVPLTHTNICTRAHDLSVAHELVEGDRCLNVMPLFYSHGLVSTLLASLIAGASIVCTPGFDASKFFPWVEEFRPTWYTASPSIHHAVLERAALHREIIMRYPFRFIRSGTAHLPSQVLAELEKVFSAPVIEIYGLTETSVITSHPQPPRERKAGSVGVTIGLEVAIMDEMGTLLPVRETGEIVVRGPTVIKGYANDPVATRSAFRHGWFRTGDQGYLDTDGYLFLTGRLKEIINRGGEKIIPQEVDEVLLDYPAVAQAVTFAMPHARLGEEVAAAVVLHRNASATASEIRQFAATRLAAFKVPRRVLIVDELPKSPTSKLQRIGLEEKLGLAAPDQEWPIMQEDLEASGTPLEEVLAGLWAQVLDREHLGIHDDFFHLGGDSLLATELISRVYEATHVELTFHSFFGAPTIADMARSIERISWDVASFQAPPIQSVPRDRTHSISFAQQRLWFLAQLQPDCAVYNIPIAFRLKGVLHVAALEQALSEIIRRHEVLRTTFPAEDGWPVQVIAPARPLRLPKMDLRELPGPEQEARVRALAREEVQRPFNLAQGPLLRAALVRLTAEEHVLLLAMHHIISDGWSQGVFWRELGALYEAFAAGKPSPLPELPIQYADFAVWQRQWLQGEVLEAQLAYWQQQLAGAPMVQLPTDRPRLVVQTFRGARHRVAFSSSLTQGLKALGQGHGATLFMTLLAAFQVLLHRYTDQDDIVVGSPIAGRDLGEIEGLIGFFANTLVLRTNLSGDPSFRELLGRIRKACLGAYTHRDLPFEKLVEGLQPQRDLSWNPLFQVMFVLQNMPRHTPELAGLTLSSLEVYTETAKFDLTLELSETPDGLRGWFEYSTDLFDAATIARMAGHLRTLLECILSDPEQRLSILPLSTADERQQLLLTWNDTTTDYPQDTCVHNLFEAQVARTPDAIAAVSNGIQLTYRELNQRANRLAQHLRVLGVGPEVLVGLCVERSLEMVVGLLGILKAGGAYVPLDPGCPKERLAFMLEDARAPVLLTQERLLTKLPEHRAHVICLDTEWYLITLAGEEKPDSGVKADNLAYVIYTSGSTGRPKGVMVPHQGLVNYVHWCKRKYGAAEGRGIPVHSPLCFDLTVTSLFVPLLVGQKLVLLPEIQDMEALGVALCTGSDFSFVKLTPTHLVMLNQLILAKEAKGGTRALIIGGEALWGEHLTFWKRHAPSTRIINEYGPTETVVGCCVYEMPIKVAKASAVPIGRPIANTQLYVLDRHLQPMPIGIPGELYVGGVGLARGYLNQPEMTAETFIPHPFNTEPGVRLYKTEDLVRYLPDGDLEFLSRLDHQVKMRGFRIELREIEAALGQHPAVHRAVVLAREDTLGDTRLVAYIVPDQAPLPTSSALRRFLQAKLPDYMVPFAFVLLATLPMTPNGKIDRQALPAPDWTHPELAEAFVAPRNMLEKGIAETWQQLLGIPSIGIHDNFFELGGHSLLVIQVISRLRQMFRVALPVRSVFEAPTVAELAAHIETTRWAIQDPQATLSISAGDCEEREL